MAICLWETVYRASVWLSAYGGVRRSSNGFQRRCTLSWTPATMSVAPYALLRVAPYALLRVATYALLREEPYNLLRVASYDARRYMIVRMA
eukprot:546486-Rhodomonas_salina.1